MLANRSHSQRRAGAEKRLLIVGLACVDIINFAAAYPDEDTDQYVIDQLVCRGGNASTTSVVLAQLGSPVEWLGTLAMDALYRVIIEDFNIFGVMYDNAHYYEDVTTPLSCVIINQATGSRTILHKNKSLPMVTLEDFMKLDLRNYSIIHFEGMKNQENIEKMISQIEEFNESLAQHESATPIAVSIEAEKGKNVPVNLLKRGDYVFISKDYSKFIGFNTAEECLKSVKEHGLVKLGATVICAWGEKGAWGMDEKGRILHSPAFPPSEVVDTLGAGDTFNAGVLHALSHGRSVEDALKLGCQVAGQKVGKQGFNIDVDALEL